MSEFGCIYDPSERDIYIYIYIYNGLFFQSEDFRRLWQNGLEGLLESHLSGHFQRLPDMESTDNTCFGRLATSKCDFRREILDQTPIFEQVERVFGLQTKLQKLLFGQLHSFYHYWKEELCSFHMLQPERKNIDFSWRYSSLP